uniref:biotin synthase BioB n=1 Tax=Eubacterium cellulosolvens TaxID=29322 RepID=UPI0004800E87|nr:biotin synthase BioB [[Eubacterium] cellulosolvens]
MAVDCLKLADEIIAGKKLEESDDLSFFLAADLAELRQGADRIRAHFCGDKVDLCTIISGKEGRCSENCKFCAQSAHHHTGCEVHDLLDEDEVLAAARANQEEGVDRFAMVNSGRRPTEEDFEKIIGIYTRMRDELKIGLCCSLGFLTSEQFRRLKEAGVTAIHCNIETSLRNFPNVCTTHTFAEKIENIRRAQAEGLSVCSGGIIGMGETWQDRIDMAFTLRSLGIRSVPVNSLMPIKGTPMENLSRLTEEDIIRTICIFRYINPEADIRLAGGRSLMADNGKSAFSSGASASITGNMLTTSGSTIRQDKEMLAELGRDTTPDRERSGCGCR